MNQLILTEKILGFFAVATFNVEIIKMKKEA